ncbi:hypothetical protein GDO78_001456 [Eleutherodactylus coqui]|uniref:DNA-directed RNA polymerase subunit n=1 Tax=Eleutherodactylus coqui TaxID=57060 RepID=A0A8J6FS16_ELECQ|nr:hypothetical protein GDO78_001456 [Eleutherodactylus coqui]
MDRTEELRSTEEEDSGGHLHSARRLLAQETCGKYSMAEPGHRRESGQHKAGAPSTRAAAALSCLTAPSFSDACGLINSRHSCLAVKTHRRHLALSPKYLHQKRSGIKELLSAELLKYNVGLAGVLVAYDNIKLVGGLGDIHDDIGFIHVNIEADFVIFQPECGQRLVVSIAV